MKATAEWPKYIEFEETDDTGKTKTWVVLSKDKYFLGDIKWHGAWRCYAFHPQLGTLYEHRCLEDIARFCHEQTAELRGTWKQSRSRLVKAVK